MTNLTADIENYDKALRWMLRLGGPGEALRMVTRLGRLWWSTDLSRGIRRLDECLSAEVGDDAHTDRAIAQVWRGRIALRLGRLSDSLASLEEAITAAERAAEGRLAATARADLALVLMERGHSNAARPMLEASSRWFEANQDVAALADVLDSLGIVEANETNWSEASRLFTESIDLYEQVGDDTGVAWVNGDRAAMALARGESDLAVELAEAAATVADHHQDRPLQCWSDHYVGVGLCCQGNTDEALTPLLRGMGTARLLGDSRLTILGLEGYAMLQAAQGQDGRAVSLAESATQLRVRTGILQTQLERIVLDSFVLAAGARLGAAAADLARRHGRNLTLERAIALAESV